MAIEQMRFLAVFFTANLFTLFALGLPADAADGPNRQTHSDVAAGRWIDSLLGPDLPTAKQARTNRPRPQRRVAERRSSLRGKLVNNPNRRDGSPPFALVDRYGGVLRYIEPVKTIDLKNHLGQVVSVKHDTGDILLASQLTLPRTRRAVAANGDLQLAQNLEPIPAGEPVPAERSAEESYNAGEIIGDESDLQFNAHDNGPIYLEGEYDEGLNFGGCSSCGDRSCGGGNGCGFGARGVMYAHGEYLLWGLEGMNTPALVIQFQDLNVGTGEVVAPITTIYGGNRFLEDERSGGRITLGLWLDDYGQWGIEGDYLSLGEIDERFVAGTKEGLVPAVGSFIGRPFFNTGVIGGVLATRGPSQEDVDTNRLDGTVSVDMRSEFQSGGIRLRHNLCCRAGCDTGCGDAVGCGDSLGCGVGVGCGSAVAYPIGPLNRLCTLLRKGTRHTDVLYGVRFANLDESLRVVEDLQQFTSIITNPPTLGNDIDVVDRFGTENQFLGGEIGYETEWQFRRWSLNFLSKVAIGNTRQTVNISGSTTIDDGLGAVDTTSGGLLTQSFTHPDGFVVGNIGSYERDEFSMIPELGLTMGYNLTRRLKLTAGYTLLYWSNVVRPGDQIDLDVNGNLLNRNGVPDPATIVPGDHPRFVFRQTDLWAQGLNLGAEYTW